MHASECRFYQEARVRAVADLRLQVDKHLGYAQQVAVREALCGFLEFLVEFRRNVQFVGREGVEPAVDEVAQELAEPVEEGGKLDTAVDGLVAKLILKV